ncbi:MAG: ATP-binding protein [Bacilli bacterium]|nr:ATP-binding protein [Bacilli bacterium]
MENVNLSYNKKIVSELKKELSSAKKDEKFIKLCQKLDIDDSVAAKYTSKLEDTLCELSNCKNCKGIFQCKNKLEGYVSYPKKEGNRLIFSYIPCKYTKAIDDEIDKKNHNPLEDVRMKDIDITDKKRQEVICYLDEFFNNYSPSKNNVGLYLHGSFGSGKSFLVSALLNELHEKKKASVCMIYFPEALRTLKDDWDNFGSKIEYLKSVDILLIDDIGAEKVTEWGRDEVLGTILQARMDKQLATFFTSNLTIKELESHLALSNKSDDLVKARRIIERIKQLTNDLELISVNRREK